jgi:hypothetical protein
MSLSPVKIEILETLLIQGKPLNVPQIAEETRQEQPSVRGHLLGLLRTGYIVAPEKGFYSITVTGKKAIGIPELNRESAKSILAYAPHDKSFNFYSELNKPLNMHAHSLQDFTNKIPRVDVKSIEFHFNRGDFEAWFTCLGDIELAKKMALLKKKKVVGEELRVKLQGIVEQRCKELQALAEPAMPL